MLDDFAAFRLPYRKAGQSKGIKVLCSLLAGGQIKSFETSLNTTSFVNYGKTLMSVKMDPEPGSGAITLSPGGQ